MRVRDRIGVITDLFLGAVHADHRFRDEEKRAVTRLICALICKPEVPPEVRERIDAFDPEHFDVEAAAQDFQTDPPMHCRRLLELVSQLCLSDGELDLEEDEYMRRLGRALGMAPLDYEDLVLDYEIHELRRSFEMIRISHELHPEP